MKIRHQMFWVALACSSFVMISPGAVAQTAIGAGAPSQEEIGRQLKFRGLPTLGTAAAPQPGPAQGIVPANSPSLPPLPRETNHLPLHPAATPPAAPLAPPSVTLRTITFEFGSAQLKPGSTETLRNLGNALNQELKGEKAFVIEGHTDRAGTRAYNDELSKRRADAVKDYLVRDMGVAADRLRAAGKGFSQPADPKHPYAAGNRRVVVINAGQS
jgi:OmpA-OmpF porin, OOP family